MMMMVTVSIKWINVKANLVLSCLGLFPVSLPVLLCSTVQYSYRNEAASFKVQGNGKNEREQTSKEKNKKRETKTRFTNTTNNTIQYITDLRKTTGIKHQCTMLIIPRNHIMTVSRCMFLSIKEHVSIQTSYDASH